MLELHPYHTLRCRFKERGMAFVVSMIFLVILTLLALSAMRSSLLEEKMAGNSRDWLVALNAAEAALRDAEADVQSGQRFRGDTGFNATCQNGLCKISNMEAYQYMLGNANAGWLVGDPSVGPSVIYGTYSGASPSTISGVARQPRYLIEAIPVKNPPKNAPKYGSQTNDFAYRVTARGFGNSVDANGNPIAQVTLQTIYRIY